MNNNINSSINVLTSIKDNKIWNGSASTYLCGQIEDIIKSLEVEKENLNKFSSACDLLEKLINYDEEISKLERSFINVSKIDDSDKLKEAECINSNISSQIYYKKGEREKTRNDILNILSEFDVIADMSVIIIPNIDGAKVLFEFDAGCIYEFVAENGRKYQAYVPYQINPEKQIVVYDAGDSGDASPNSYENWELFKKYFESNSYDQVVLRSLRGDNSYYYSDLCNQLNIDPPERLFVSHSGGTMYNMKEYVQLLDEQGNKPGILGIMDGWINVGSLNKDGSTDKIKDSDTVILGFYPNYENSYSNSYKTYAQTGVNMLMFKAKNDGFGLDHNKCNASLVKNGVLEFLNGNGTLPDNYEIYRYNPDFDTTKAESADNVKFISVDYSDVSTIDDIYKYFNINN